MPALILRSGSFSERVWSRFTERWSCVLSLILLLLLFVTAALAPVLSQDQPLWIEGEGGTLRFPLFASFTSLDWFWCGLFLASVFTWCVVRFGSPLESRGRRIALAAAAGMGVALIPALATEPTLETRRYRAEESGRLALAAFDQEVAQSGKPHAVLIEQGHDLAERNSLSQRVAIAALERVAALSRGTEGAAELEALARENEQALDRLQRAVYPLNRHDPAHPGASSLAAPGSRAHILGCDRQGRDMLARLIHGSRSALSVALGATAMIALIGSLFGLLAGYYGGFLDRLISRLTEVTLCLPALVILIAAPAWVPHSWRQSPLLMITFLGLILWPQAARLVRAEVQHFKRQDLVRSAVALGLKDRRIILRHVLPGIVPPLLVSLGLTAGNLIILESSLSFLGLGPEDLPSWGRMLADARRAALIGNAWHVAIFPGVAVVAGTLVFNVLSQNLERALNPRR